VQPSGQGDDREEETDLDANQERELERAGHGKRGFWISKNAGY
jgi:hypothetical protein